LQLEQPRLSAIDQGASLAEATGARLVDAGLIAYGRAFEHPCKIRILKWLIRRLAAGRIKVKHAGGVVVTIDPDDYIGWEIFTTGRYESASLALAQRIVGAEPGLFVDVGANFGWYTLAIASITGSTVISIEPDCENCSSLRANIAHNGLRNIVVCNTAAGPNLTMVPMSRRSPGNSGTVSVRSGSPASYLEPYWVATTPLQALLTRLVCPPTRPVLMKMDVEGFEPHALAGLDFDGAFRPKNLLLECDPALLACGWGSRDNLASCLSAKGYTLLDVFGRPFAPDGPLPEDNVWARDCRQSGYAP
jgi:FkbM family methyltransferase